MPIEEEKQDGYDQEWELDWFDTDEDWDKGGWHRDNREDSEDDQLS